MTKWEQQDLFKWTNAEYDSIAGKFEFNECHDVTPIIEKNLELQKDEQNGFFKETRSCRRIGQIPVLVYLRDIKPLIDSNPENTDVIWYAFLQKHPEYRTVDKLLHTSPSSNIIIK